MFGLTVLSVKCDQKTLAQFVADLNEYILFCDNIKRQINLLFLSKVCKHKGIIWRGITNGTHFWEPVDAGPDKTFVSQ